MYSCLGLFNRHNKKRGVWFRLNFVLAKFKQKKIKGYSGMQAKLFTNFRLQIICNCYQFSLSTTEKKLFVIVQFPRLHFQYVRYATCELKIMMY